MTVPVTSADDLIVNVENNMLGIDTPPVERRISAPEAPQEEAPAPKPETPSYEEPKLTPDETLASSDGLDDYGNEAPKPKMYTQDEVNEQINRVVRERVKRGNLAQPEVAQQPFQYDDSNPDNWETQLEGFVEKTFEKMSQKQIQQQHQYREQQLHQEFEAKLSQGMSRFNDFVEVVSPQPITDAMTMATRSMKDPAAFLYAASKTQAAELQRISQIQDRYAQVAEIGRLEERMRKSRTTSAAAKPISKQASDAPSGKSSNDLNIDDKIRQHATWVRGR